MVKIMTLNELKEKMTCWTYEKDLVHVYLFQMFQFSFLNFIINNLPVGRFKSEFLSSGGEYTVSPVHSSYKLKDIEL